MATTHDDEEHVTSNTSSDASIECPFNPEIASKLSTAFAKATGIDIEFANQLLHDYHWNIDQALQATYEAKEPTHSKMMLTIENESILRRSDWNKYLTILSWHTDTIDSDEMEINDLIQQRTETMIEILLRDKPDVILLQQVGTFALTLFITSLSAFYDDESIQIDSPINCNYISIFTRKSTMKKIHLSILQNTAHWKMMKLEVEYQNSIKFDLFNALIDENTASFCFEQIDQSNNPEHLIISAISSQISDDLWNSQTIHLDDLWEKAGQQTETAYTSDPDLNSNIHDEKRPQRYDRLLFRSLDHRLQAMHMEFKGLEHIKTSDRLFPSTHWPIQGYFHIDH